MNIVLSEALWLLADLHENSPSASDRLAKLETLLEGRPKRFYYEAFLERSPENSAVADIPVTHPMRTLREFMASDEFAAYHMKIVRDLFPDRNAMFFLHIPKTGGHTVCESMERSQRFVWLLMPDLTTQSSSEERLLYYGKLISWLRSSSKNLTIGGHPTASFLLDIELKKPQDRIFSIVREPFDLMISWLNYLLTIVHSEWSSNPDFNGRPDAKRVDSLIGHDWCRDPSGISGDHIERLITEIIYSNPICRSIGAEPTFVSAVDTRARLDVEVVPLHGINQFCEKNGFPVTMARNISRKFIDKKAIHRRAAEMICDRIGEDLKFYKYLENDRFT